MNRAFDGRPISSVAEPWRFRYQDLELGKTPANIRKFGGAIFIETAFESLTGQPLSTGKPVYVERFDHGGMSGRHVSQEFWQDKAIPLLLARYAETE